MSAICVCLSVSLNSVCLVKLWLVCLCVSCLFVYVGICVFLSVCLSGSVVGVCLSVCAYMCMFVCLFLCLSIRVPMSDSLSVSPSVQDSDNEEQYYDLKQKLPREEAFAESQC